uniref:Uncharacterized protein n=1 Tax=Aegilops tauschii subsp. strangulata TaxID=200361 RepID=A0A453BI69_AEGTS
MDACLCPAASAPMPATAPSRHDQRQQSPRRLTVCRCAPWPWGLETCIVEGQQLGAEQPYKAEGVRVAASNITFLVEGEEVVVLHVGQGSSAVGRGGGTLPEALRGQQHEVQVTSINLTEANLEFCENATFWEFWTILLQ